MWFDGKHEIRKSIRLAYFAGQPRVKSVLDMRVSGSKHVSTIDDASTVGSHSFLSSGVARTAFQASRDAKPSSAGISNTTLTTSSPLTVLRCMTTSETRGRCLPFAVDDAATKPFAPAAPEPVALSPEADGTGTLFQLSVAVLLDSSERNRSCACLSAASHDS